jgi:hypothetical protein
LIRELTSSSQSLAVNEIQRVYRGHVGRKIARKLANEKDNRREKAMYTYFALQLQRAFRAFHSRKYRFDFAKRKREVQFIIQKGEEIREQMNKYAQEQQQVSNSAWSRKSFLTITIH